MSETTLNSRQGLDVADTKRRLKAIFIGSVGNLVEWYDFYAYTAFALYFAPHFFPSTDPVVPSSCVRSAAGSSATSPTAMAGGCR
jgi:MHS family alpha-ketoglutarate permease-like MFS transporter